LAIKLVDNKNETIKLCLAQMLSASSSGHFLFQKQTTLQMLIIIIKFTYCALIK